MSDSWFKLATRGAVVRRAIKTALVVGCVLVAINHGDVLWMGDIGAGRFLQIALTFLVPYVVSTSSSVAAMRAVASAVPSK